MRLLRLLPIAVVLLLCSASPALAAGGPDSDAPRGAPAHWLPNEPWVYGHWLPFDETRMHDVLGIDRTQLERQLVDRRTTLLGVARRNGWKGSQRALALKLLAPRRGTVPAKRWKLLLSRTMRVLDQSHLARHLLFHDLHQTAIARSARSLFGIPTARYTCVRKASRRSAAQLGARVGRSRQETIDALGHVLRREALAGVRGGAATSGQMERVLKRQLTDLKWWVDTRDYLGPRSSRSSCGGCHCG